MNSCHVFLVEREVIALLLLVPRMFAIQNCQSFPRKESRNMATIINNPSSPDGTDARNWLLPLVVALALVTALLYWGLPYLRGMTGASSNNATVPPTTENQNTTNIQSDETQPNDMPDADSVNLTVPEEIDVNVQNGMESTDEAQ